MNLETIEKVTGILVNLTVIAGAITAVIKFKLYKLFGYRYKSEFIGTHHEISEDKIIFEGEYIIHNTGERPIRLNKVILGLYNAKSDNGQLVADENNEIFKRIIQNTEKTYKGLFEIEAGERTIFTIRHELKSLNDVIFVKCCFEWSNNRPPSPYYSMYIKKKAITTFWKS